MGAINLGYNNNKGDNSKEIVIFPYDKNTRFLFNNLQGSKNIVIDVENVKRW